MKIEGEDKELLLKVFYEAIGKHELDLIRFKHESSDTQFAQLYANKCILAYTHLLNKLKLNKELQ